MTFIDEIVASFRNFRDEDSIAAARSFKPKETDVFVTTFHKCGTNWVRHICNMLRSGGDMEFEEELYPLATAKALGIDPDSEQPYTPRLYMTHERLDRLQPGAKYINVLRDPKDATVSMHKMQTNVFGVTDEEYPMAEFCKNFLEPEEADKWLGTISQHFNKAIEMYKKYPDNILIVYYEDLKENPKEQIKRIAEFMGVSTEESNLEIAYQKSTFDFMAQHKQKFGSASFMKYVFSKMTPAIQKYMGEKKGKVVSVVNKGKVGGGKVLPDFAVSILEREWKKDVEAIHGFKNYADLRANLK